MQNPSTILLATAILAAGCAAALPPHQIESRKNATKPWALYEALSVDRIPGFTPKALPLPVEMLDFAAVAYPNAPWLTRPEVDARIAELAPPTSLEPATNYTDEAIDILKGRLWRGDETVGKAASADYAYDAHIANLLRDDGSGALYFPTDFVLRSTFTNDVCNIVTNEVAIYGDQWTIEAGEGTGYSGLRLIFVEYDTASLTPDTGSVMWICSYEYQYPEMPEDEWESNTAAISGYLTSTVLEDSGVIFRRVPIATRNALGLARMEDLPSTNGMVTAAALTNAVRSVAYAVNDYAWDGDVCWRRELRQGGFIEFVAVTNIDVRLPENHEALEALEKARRNQK